MYPHHLESKDLVIIFKSFHEPCQVAGMMTCWGDKILLRHLLKAKEVIITYLHNKQHVYNYANIFLMYITKDYTIGKKILCK